MTADEYFNDHIPHRFNLLIAFRTRYSDSHQSDLTLGSETYRDLFRCAKDICFIMTRFFCEELGLTVDRQTQQLRDVGNWVGRHGITRVRLNSIANDPRCPILVRMLQAANGAVAHMDDVRVNHYFRTHQEEQEMVLVINWIENLVSDHIYQPAERSLSSAMQKSNNIMSA